MAKTKGIDESVCEPYKYKSNVPNCPHICIKVPTAGEKIFIACNALRPIFEEVLT